DDPDAERALLQHWAKDAAKQIAARPLIIDEALPVIAGRTWDGAGKCEWVVGEREEKADRFVLTGWIANRTHEERVAAVFHYPKNCSGNVVVSIGSDAGVDKAGVDGAAGCLPQRLAEPAPGTAQPARNVDGER